MALGLAAMDLGQLVPVEFVRLLLTLPGASLLPGWALLWAGRRGGALYPRDVPPAIVANMGALVLLVAAIAGLGIGITRTSVLIAINVLLAGLLVLGAIGPGRSIRPAPRQWGIAAARNLPIPPLVAGGIVASLGLSVLALYVGLRVFPEPAPDRYAIFSVGSVPGEHLTAAAAIDTNERLSGYRIEVSPTTGRTAPAKTSVKITGSRWTGRVAVSAAQIRCGGGALIRLVAPNGATVRRADFGGSAKRVSRCAVHAAVVRVRHRRTGRRHRRR